MARHLRGFAGPASQARAVAEYAQLRASSTYAGIGVPSGDGTSVILAPGFGMSQGSLSVLAEWLRRIGYRPAPAGIGRNTGCSTAMARRLEARVERAFERSGRPVAIVGHSRGGQLARVVAGRHPERVCAVVTLGSPLWRADVNLTLRLVGASMGAVSLAGVPGLLTPDCLVGAGCCEMFWSELGSPPPAGVPLTQIWSERDGVVAVRGLRPPDGGVRVNASHVGMIWNGRVFQVIADALAAPAAHNRPPVARRRPD